MVLWAPLAVLRSDIGHAGEACARERQRPRLALNHLGDEETARERSGSGTPDGYPEDEVTKPAKRLDCVHPTNMSGMFSRPQELCGAPCVRSR